MAIASTIPGHAFLQDAFAPPDFQALEVFGVPDKYVGRTITKQHLYSGVIPRQTDLAASLLNIMIPPIPGVAYCYCYSEPGENLVAADWYPVPFVDTSSTFPHGQEDANFIKFRYVSLCAEMTTTANLLNVDGSISVIQTPMDMVNQKVDIGGTGFNVNQTYYMITGGQGMTSVVERSSYTKPTNEGFYSVSTHKQPDWDFKPILTGLNFISDADRASNSIPFIDAVSIPTGGIRFIDGNSPSVTGWGDHDVIIAQYRPSTTPTTLGAAAGFHLAVWATVEYQVQTNSILADMAHASPGLDELAMEHYRCMAAKIPPAVPQKKNAGFWSTLLSGIATAGKFIGGLIPGPWGAIASGVGAAAGMFGGGSG